MKALSIVALLSLALSLAAQSKKGPFAPVQDDPKLQRVLLIGDSISIGYTLPTREFLKGKANLHRIPTNGGPTTRGLANLDAWLGKGKWDVIHFNWGLHDLKYMGSNGQNLVPKEQGGKVQVSLAHYEKNLEQLVQRLKKTGARLIWRNTTPIPPGSKARYVGDSVKYNEAAARVMKKHGIPTHDLYTLSKKRMKELMRPANVHYTPEGSRVLGREVARVIESALEK